jgi:dihydroflavonol-4-reductase
MHSKKILVTGGTGFIGSYLLRHLVKQGYQNIRALKRRDSSMALVHEVADKIEWVEADLLDLPVLGEAMQGAGQVYHCAAIVSFNENDSRRMFKINQEGTANIVNIALDEGVERLIHVSSIAALGRTPKGGIIDEQAKWQNDSWNSPYGISKHLAEMEVWRGVAEGLNAAVVNPSNVLGSGFWNGRTSTGQIFYKIWKGLPFYPRGGSGFVDVRDVARFTVRLMESEISNQRFILTGENLSFKSLFDEIAQTLGVKPPAIEVNPFIREMAWRAAWLASKITGKPAFITKQTARSSARTFRYDNQKSLEAFDFAYTPISQTIRETGKQFLACEKENFTPAVLDF